MSVIIGLIIWGILMILGMCAEKLTFNGRQIHNPLARFALMPFMILFIGFVFWLVGWVGTLIFAPVKYFFM